MLLAFLIDAEVVRNVIQLSSLPFCLCIEDPSKEVLTWVLVTFTWKTSPSWMRSRWLSISPGGMGCPSWPSSDLIEQFP